MREALVNQLSKRVALSLRALERAREGGATSREVYTALLATTLTRLTLLRKTLLSVGRRDHAKKLSLSILQLLEELQALGLSASELQQHALAEVDWVIARASRMRSGRSRKRTALTDREGSEALRDDGTPSMVQPQGRGKARREGRTLVEGAPQTKPTLGFFQTAAVSGPKDFLETHQSIEKPLSDGAEGDQPPHRLQPLRHEAFASAP